MHANEDTTNHVSEKCHVMGMETKRLSEGQKGVEVAGEGLLEVSLQLGVTEIGCPQKESRDRRNQMSNGRKMGKDKTSWNVSTSQGSEVMKDHLIFFFLIR